MISLHYGGLRLKSRYLLSPLAGFTNLPFRRIVHELGGVGLGTTDLVNARSLLERRPKALDLIATHPDDSPFAVQIFGHDPCCMRDAAQFLEEYGVDSIDINMGCPVDKVTKTGGGSALMRLPICDVGGPVDDFQLCHSADAAEGTPLAPSAVATLVRSVVDAVRVPVTVKMRLGWDETQITAPRFAREFEQAGVAAIAIHGRTRAQGFSGSVDRSGIRRVVEAVERIPVIGNGDVRTVDDAARMLDETGCTGVSIGRGALANPWIFRQLVQWEQTGTYDPPGGFDDRLQLLRRQFAYLCELHPEPRAIVMFRKMGHWYLRGMRVRPHLRHQFQLAATSSELEVALAAIQTAGPHGVSRSGVLPDLHVPVPSGPVERW
ncbi:MAG: tRNA-dihydrouridine synthase [Planctomycetaceae bacterium]|nr:tRNA-dihydrouridine synthase [Planctomycetaceae bacterium]